MIFDKIASSKIQTDAPFIKENVMAQETKIIEKENIKKTQEQLKINTKDTKTLKDIAKELTKQEVFYNNNLAFDYNEEAKVFVVTVQNGENNEIVKQFPTEDFIKRLIYYRKLEEKNLALFLDEKI